MSEALLGWPNGSLGMLLGSLAGLLIVVQAWRNQPWDIHDENAYREPPRITLGAVTPSLILLAALLTLLLGLGALDRGIWPPYAIAGDIIGLLALPFSTVYVFRGIK